jgi:5'-3' exonuclease
MIDLNLDDITFEVDSSRPSVSSTQKPYDWLLIDGGGLVVTAWASQRNEEKAHIRVQGGVYVFVSVLASLARLTADNARVVVCWDGYDNRKWRRGLHPWYKHGRGSSINRQEVKVVISKVSELLSCMGIAQTKVDGREADDVVATISKEVSSVGQRCLLFSDDKDFIQLISDNIHLCRRSLKGIVLSPEQCDMMEIEYGEKYLHIKAMAGDSGDNIKGLIGIGEKKALNVLNAIPDLVDLCLEDFESVPWDCLGRSDYRAIVRAGRKITWPPLMKDAEFAKKFAESRGFHAPVDYDIPDENCLKASAREFIRCLNLVRMDSCVDYGALDFPKVDEDSISDILRTLELDEERELISRIYALMKMRDSKIAPSRSSAERAGSSIEHEIGPEDMF